MTIPGLDIDKDYYVAIKTTDDAGNQSGLSIPFFFTSMQESLERNGENTGDFFGQSVAKVGDINGDGVPDFAVGARSDESSGSGSVNIFFGGATINSNPDIILEGAPGEQFGWSVAGVGDVNGDGCSDIIVGANKHDSPFTESGAAYIYFGSGTSPCPPNINPSPDVTLTGVGTNEEFGYSVSGAGDINQDGFSDFLVGALNNILTTPGSAYLFFGSASLSSTDASQANITFTGQTNGDRFGIGVSGGGDFDGDNIPDLVIGADFAYISSSDGGAAYVYFGSGLSGLSGDLTVIDADVVFDGKSANDQFGWSVGVLNDMNGDNFDDLVVGTPVPNLETGAAYVFFGGAGFISKNAMNADLTILGESSGDEFGWAVADAGDLNVDGFTDLIVGATQSATDRGIAYVFYGSAVLGAVINASTADVTRFGENSEDGMGTAVAGIGDTNGDGYDEFVVGAPLNDINIGIETGDGAVYIYR